MGDTLMPGILLVNGIESDNEDLEFDCIGAGKTIKFKRDGVEVASIDEDGFVGTIVKTSRYHNDVTTTMPSQDNYVMWTFTYNKVKGTESDLFVTGMLPGRGNSSHWMGLYVEFNGERNYQGIIVLNNSDNANTPMAILIHMDVIGFVKGPITIKIGWDTANNTSNKPFANEWNTAGDARQPLGTGSYVQVTEVINA